ncbi:MAG TPA: Wzz/FepE/Etk N-terminal domain-containing protein [Acidimicrobiales bacterium]|nr:Wzz/FepE/Etk N-terminal domain-containing protein [Acidimicrobiales bacterium]
MTAAVDRYISSLEEVGPGEEGAGTGRVVDLRTIRASLRRRRRIWLSCAVLGLVIGAAMHLVVAPKYQAVTTLYLTEPGTGTYKVTDDVNLLETDTVAARALGLIGIHDLNDMPGNYEGTALGDMLVTIEADASTPAAAVRWARALAEGFLYVRAKILGDQTAVAVASQENQEKQLESEINGLNSAINALSGSKSLTSSNQVSEMVDARSADVNQLTVLQNEVQQDLLEENAVNQGSFVLDPAEALLVHSKRIVAEDSLTGLIGGLAFGLGVVVVGAIISDRPRYRADVAALLGAPVELSLRGRGEAGIVAQVVRRRGYPSKPRTGLLLAQSRLREKLKQYTTPALALVSTGERSAAAAAEMLTGVGLAMAVDGKRVALVDMAKGRPLAKLLKARRKGDPVRNISLRGQQLRLAVAPTDVAALNREEVTHGADAVLVLADVDPALGAEHLRPWAEDAVVVLRAGEVSNVLLEAVGQLLRDAGVLPVSAILLGADKGDETSGAVEGADPLVGPQLGAHRRQRAG